VFGYDTTKDGGVRVGGDHITVGRAATGTFDLDTDRITRQDGQSWQEQGFAVGLHVSIAGIEGSFTIAGFGRLRARPGFRPAAGPGRRADAARTASRRPWR
jgi:hypothetical protein